MVTKPNTETEPQRVANWPAKRPHENLSMRQRDHYVCPKNDVQYTGYLTNKRIAYYVKIGYYKGKVTHAAVIKTQKSQTAQTVQSVKDRLTIQSLLE